MNIGFLLLYLYMNDIPKIECVLRRLLDLFPRIFLKTHFVGSGGSNWIDCRLFWLYHLFGWDAGMERKVDGVSEALFGKNLVAWRLVWGLGCDLGGTVPKIVLFAGEWFRINMYSINQVQVNVEPRRLWKWPFHQHRFNKAEATEARRWCLSGAACTAALYYPVWGARRDVQWLVGAERRTLVYGRQAGAQWGLLLYKP